MGKLRLRVIILSLVTQSKKKKKKHQSLRKHVSVAASTLVVAQNADVILCPHSHDNNMMIVMVTVCLSFVRHVL